MSQPMHQPMQQSMQQSTEQPAQQPVYRPNNPYPPRFEAALLWIGILGVLFVGAGTVYVGAPTAKLLFAQLFH